MIHKFDGKKYTIQRVSPEELQFEDLDEDEICWGICSDPNSRDRYIKLDKTIKGKSLLILSLHEFLHATRFSLSESEVERMSQEMGECLWKMGYRKVK